MRYLLVDPSRALDVRLFCTRSDADRTQATDSGVSAGTRERKSERERAKERNENVSFLLMRDLAKHTRIRIYIYICTRVCVRASERACVRACVRACMRCLPRQMATNDGRAVRSSQTIYRSGR